MRVVRISHSAVVAAWRAREQSIRDLGIDVELFTAQRWDEGGSEVPLVAESDEAVVGVRTWGRHPALFLYDPVPLIRMLRQHWDLIDIHEEPFALATAEILLLRRLLGQRAPYVLYSAQNLRKRYPPPFRWFERVALKGAAGVHVCNAAAGEIVQSKGFPGRASLIGLGVDTFKFSPGVREKLDSDVIRVGYSGRLELHKGVRVLLEAIATDERLCLRIAGAGSQEAAMLQQATDLCIGHRVEFLGSLDAGSLAGFYRGIDVLAIPSLTTPSWVEQFGRVAVEAMACGTPVVASASGALPDVVSDAGILVPENDPHALADALLRAADEPKRTRLVNKGRDRAMGYDWHAVGSAYADLYRRARHEPMAVLDRKLEVVLVAYGVPHLVDQALAPLQALAVTVVDNSSSPDIAQVCERHGARYFDSGRNAGFGAGVNLALRNLQHPGADVLLVNPDAVIDVDGVAALREGLLAEPDLASVGPAQVDGAGKSTRVAWPFPSPWRYVQEAVGLGRFGKQDDYVIGSVLLLRREALDQVGDFDERFFLYSEEADWARRAIRLGWRHSVVRSVTATHLGAATSESSETRDKFFYASQEIYLRKHFGTLGWQVARFAQVAGSALRAVVLSGERATEAQLRMHRYLVGPLAKQDSDRLAACSDL